MICLPLLCGANIIVLENYKLAEKVLQSKSRFVFSDFSEENELLKDAKAEFDFYMVPKNYKNEANSAGDNTKLRMYVMMAESQEAKKIQSAIKDNRELIDKVGIDYIIRQNIPETSLAFYKMVEIDKVVNRAMLEKNRFKESVKIKYEGVYYTYLMYEEIPDFKEDKNGGNRMLKSDLT